MWGTVLVFALMGAPELSRIGMAALLISRPRPMHNLLAFWLGGIGMCILIGLGVLFVLRDFALKISQGVAALAASSTFGHIQIALGVLALLMAVQITVGFSVRQRARMSIPGGDPSALVLQPNTPTAFSRLTTRAQDVLAGGSPWVAFVAGVWMSTTPVEYPLALAAILASGAAPGTQVNAVVVYAVVTFAIVEIPLVSYLATPAKTQAAMLQLHNWLRARRRRVLAIAVGVVGVVLVATGMASV